MLKGEEIHKKKRKGAVACGFSQNVWGVDQDKAVETLKRIVTNVPVLAYPDFKRPFILTTDASSIGLEYILSQNFPDGEHPIAYGSRVLKGLEETFSNTERETLACSHGMQYYRSYLFGRYFILRNDHQAITKINKGAIASPRVCTWAMATEEFCFDVEYVAKEKLRHADALSRYSALTYW